MLEGTLGLSPNARGIVLFAHGSGSSRQAGRNRFVADELRGAGIGDPASSTFSRSRKRPLTASRGTSASTSPCSPSGWSARRTGSPRCPPQGTSRSATLAPAPAAASPRRHRSRCRSARGLTPATGVAQTTEPDRHALCRSNICDGHGQSPEQVIADLEEREDALSRYVALACDYDGTLASDGAVDEATLAALGRRARHRAAADPGHRTRAGRAAGRLPAPGPVRPRRRRERGGAVPARRAARAGRWPSRRRRTFVTELRERGVGPLSVGRVIVATWEPHEDAVLEVIRDLGLELQVIFNKGAVMVLPSGVNKATGLAAALDELGLSPHNVVGVGDAENDHAFLGRVRVRGGRRQRPAVGQGRRGLRDRRAPRRGRDRADRSVDRQRPPRALAAVTTPQPDPLVRIDPRSPSWADSQCSAVQAVTRSRKRARRAERSAGGMSSASAMARAVPSMSSGETSRALSAASSATPAVSETTSTPGPLRDDGPLLGHQVHAVLQRVDQQHVAAFHRRQRLLAIVGVEDPDRRPAAVRAKRSLTSSMVAIDRDRDTRDRCPGRSATGPGMPGTARRPQRSGRISSRRAKARKPTSWFLLGSSRSTRMIVRRPCRAARRRRAAATAADCMRPLQRARRRRSPGRRARQPAAHRPAITVDSDRSTIDAQELRAAAEERAHVGSVSAGRRRPRRAGPAGSSRARLR